MGFFEKLELIKNCLPPPLECSWKYGIDAVDINSHLLSPSGVVWFQCPWVTGDGKTSELISNFLLNLVHKIESGSLVCVGITSLPKYLVKYNIPDFLEKTAMHYDYVGVDHSLVNEVLRYGYHHESAKNQIGGDIHMLFDHHVTLVFRKIDCILS